MTRGPALLFTLLLLTASLSAQRQPSTPSGSGTIYVGSYSGHITAVDESTGAVAKIPLQTGPPFVVRLAPDRSRFYVQSANQERFEVVDTKARQTVDTFTLSSGQRHIRALAFEVDPQHKTMIVVAKPATRLIDRWEIGAPEFLVYDLASHTITRTVPWTIDPEPGHFSVALRYSPDGALLYVFGHEITTFNTATMTVVDTWNLAAPADPTLSRFDPGPWDDSSDPQGTVTSLFVQQDSVARRKLLVVGRVDLAAKSVDVFPLGPAPEADSLSFTMSPDGRRANVLKAEIGRHEVWNIDLIARRVTHRAEVPTRTRMQMRTSSTGLLYIYEAGRTIEVYAADASKRLRTIELDSDMMYGTFVIVPGAAPSAR